PYDPDKARELLAEAGYPDGLQIESAIGSSANTYIQTGELVQSQLAAVGIEMNLQLLDAAAMVPGLFSDGPDGSGTIPSSPFGGAATADPDSGFRNIYSATGSFNAGRNVPEGLIELLDEGAGENDPAQRAALYQEANRIGVEGVYHGVPLFFEVSATASQNYVGGVTEAVSACFAPQNFFRDVYITAGKVPAEG
ncbi:MAG TPA: ABC transporter substrate-binding protein, partial [Ilumatobacter sp.]|nr:ABC transporter substrate-binding protein [Ilumatobacter sp.]